MAKTATQPQPTPATPAVGHVNIEFDEVLARMETEHAEERRRRILAEIAVQKLQAQVAELTAAAELAS
jgi:hypothetical protein